MVLVIFILAAVMALFAVLGYMFGTSSAILALVVIVLSLLILANAGGRIVTLINTLYRFILAGGVQALSGGGDLGALRTRMAAVSPLIPNEAMSSFLLLLLIIIIILAILLGRHRRFRRPPSGLGLLIGLVNGYLVGAYLLDETLPSLTATLPLPFGIGRQLAASQPAAAAAAANPSGANFGQQLLQGITAANPASLALTVMIVIAAIILIALLANVRGRGRGGGGGGGGGGGRRSNGARD